VASANSETINKPKSSFKEISIFSIKPFLIYDLLMQVLTTGRQMVNFILTWCAEESQVIMTYVSSIMKYFALVFLLFLVCSIPDGLARQDKDSINSKLTVVVLPIVYFTPETSWVFGAGTVANFKLGQASETYESQIATGIAYSLYDQILTFSNWRIYTDENKNLFLGEVGWYRYVFFFYGIGPNVEEANRESYNAILPRFRFSYARQIKPNINLGLRYTFDNFKITEKLDGGLLTSGDYVGENGGAISGLGPLLIYDSRDNQLFPTKGNYLETSIQRFDGFLGSDFNYWNFMVDARKIFQLKKDQLLATNLLGQFNAGEAPFFALSQLGGNKVMRGLFEGKYRDMNLIAFQTEYRRMFLPRWGAVAFGGVGNVFSSENPFELGQTKVTYGVGGRFKLTKKKKLNLRLDLAHSPGEDLQFYFTFGEAF
tara:strand:+ start:29200 stop:30483 length:1284 start_codon:yes stop_codon:yes gene_type:complete